MPYLGVMSVPLPEPLSAQLGLPVGFGLLVAEVLPNSPAATAGLQKFDVLKLLNDQQLIDPGQLQALVRAAGKNADVSLTIIRKGQEQKLSVKVGERMVPPMHGPFGGPGFGRGFGAPGMPGSGVNPEQFKEMRERAREFQERARDRIEQFRKQHGEPPRPDGPPHAQIAPEDILRQARPDGGSQIKMLTDGGVTTLEGSRARLLLKDDTGEIEVAGENGKRTLTARDPQGKVVFTGPVDSPEQRAAVPAAYREKLDKIQVRAHHPGPDGERHETFQANNGPADEQPPLDVQ